MPRKEFEDGRTTQFTRVDIKTNVTLTRANDWIGDSSPHNHTCANYFSFFLFWRDRFFFFLLRYIRWYRFSVVPQGHRREIRSFRRFFFGFFYYWDENRKKQCQLLGTFFFFLLSILSRSNIFGYHIKLIRYTDDEVMVVSAHTSYTTSGDLCSRADKIALQRSNPKQVLRYYI